MVDQDLIKACTSFHVLFDAYRKASVADNDPGLTPEERDRLHGDLNVAHERLSQIVALISSMAGATAQGLRAKAKIIALYQSGRLASDRAWDQSLSASLVHDILTCPLLPGS